MEINAGFWLKGWLAHLTIWKTTSPYTPTAVYYDGAALTHQANVADVVSNALSWVYFRGEVYINPPSGTPFASTVQGFTTLYYANKPKIFSGQFYEPRVKSIPVLSLQIEPKFTGVGRYGSGTCTLINNDGEFQTKHSRINWDAGTVVFKMGADTNADMAYADYQTVGTWRIESADLSDADFQLNLRELKSALEKQIPFETYSKSQYASLSDNDVGKVMPRAYGNIYGASPVLVSAGAKQFKVANHIIYDITDVRIQQNNVWVSVPFTKDVNSGEFYLGAEWADNEPVSCDFIGRKGTDGKPMYNAADIVEDLLTYLGETNLDATSFSDSWDALDVGLQSDGQRRTVYKIALYIDSPQKAMEALSQINATVGSFLYVDFSGAWHYEVYNPQPVTSLSAFSEIDILDRTFTANISTEDIFSKAVVKYATRRAESWSEVEEVTRTQNQLLHGQKSAVVREFTPLLWHADDAEYFGQRVLNTEGEPLARVRCSIPWQAFFLVPGQNVHITYSRQNYDAVLEVLEVRHDLTGGKISLVLGDRRAWADTFGWWTDDAAADWDTGATNAQVATARQTNGYWHGDDDLANSGDARSFAASRWW